MCVNRKKKRSIFSRTKKVVKQLLPCLLCSYRQVLASMLGCKSLGISLVCWWSVSPFWFLRSMFCLRGLAGFSLLLSEVSQSFWNLHDHCLMLFLSCLLHLIVCHWRVLTLSISHPEPAQLIQRRWSGGLPLWRLHPTTSCQRRLRHKPKNSLTAEGVMLKCSLVYYVEADEKQWDVGFGDGKACSGDCRRFRDTTILHFLSLFLSYAFLKVFAVWATIFFSTQCRSYCDFQSTSVHQRCPKEDNIFSSAESK